jgi:hypothetical protein
LGVGERERISHGGAGRKRQAAGKECRVEFAKHIEDLRVEDFAGSAQWAMTAAAAKLVD